MGPMAEQTTHITLQQIRNLREQAAGGIGREVLAAQYGLSLDAVDLLIDGSRSSQHKPKRSHKGEGRSGPAGSPAV